MFEAWGRLMYRRRWPVILASMAALAIAAVWGTGVFGALKSADGFATPGSDSHQAASIADRHLGRSTADLIVLYRGKDRTVDDPAFRSAVTTALSALPREHVAAVDTYWSTGSAAFVSADRRSTYAVLRLAGAEAQQRTDAYDAVRDRVTEVGGGLTAQAGGYLPTETAINERVSADIGRGEALSMPVLLVLLLVIFGGLVAASLPLIIGGIAILGSFTALHLLTYATDVSIFAINITTFLGLGLAIDYGLFIVSRFREELRGDATVEDALVRTVVTAGRTVAVSGVTVAVSLAGLLLFPQIFLRSMGFGGMATVLVDMIAALTLLPALLAVLGPRVNSLSVGLRRRKAVGGTAQPVPAAASSPGAHNGAGTGAGAIAGANAGANAGAGTGAGPLREAMSGARPGSQTSGGWYRLAQSVMRRPLIYIAVTVIPLLALGMPFLRISWGGVDTKVLPTGTETRVVAEALQRDFPHDATNALEVVVTGAGARNQQAIAAYTGLLGSLPGVTGARPTGADPVTGTIRISLGHEGEATSEHARSLVGRVRDVPEPPNTSVYVGGAAAELVDELHSLGRTMPWLALLVGVATFLLLFLAFGSVLLPIKAVLMNLLSLSATFGAVVWIFQDGHLSGVLDFTATGSIAPAMPILMLAMLFGISMDYEVFLLSRVREQYDQNGDNTAAVATGLQRTGRIITSAAGLFLVVIGAFSISGIQFIKLFGVGMIIAIIVDATVVRALLVPATMRLLGRANWWVPRPLDRVYRRYGIREETGSGPAAVSDLVTAET